MAIQEIITSGPTISVGSLDELDAAYDSLSYLEGGGTIILEPGYYGVFFQYPYGVEYEEQPVIIKSADPDDPAHFSRLYLREISNLRLENIYVNSTQDGVGDSTMDMTIQNASNIQIVDSVFEHDADNVHKDAGAIVDSMSHIRGSSNILFQGNTIDGYFHALQATEVDTLEIVGNELTNMQGDGFRGGGLQNMVIEDNYFHDFYGVDYTVTHSDLIQIWGSNANTLTQNVTITGNILMTSGAASQSIFVRNEEFGDEGDPTSGYFSNLTITDNLIYNTHRWGIHLDNVDGALVDGNTLLNNPDAVMLVNGEPDISIPEIFARNSLNITVTDNITGAVNLPEGSIQSGNQIVTYDNQSDPNYAGKHFANPFAGADATPIDLEILPFSPWYGVYGSSIGNNPGDISNGATATFTTAASEFEQYEITFDASGSVDSEGPLSESDGYSFHWSFADGTTATGVRVSKLYDSGGFNSLTLTIRLDGDTVAEIDRNIAVETKDIFAFNFEEGVVDISDGSSEVIENGIAAESDDGIGYLIGDGNKLELGRDTERQYEMESFGLTLDLAPTGDETSGVFLHLYQTMSGKITEQGYVEFQLTTDEGTYELTSQTPVFADHYPHQIGIAFDGNLGKLELYADGEMVSSGEAWGTTASAIHWNLVFGNTWNDSMDAIIDNVKMSLDTSVAMGWPVHTPPAEEPPADTPPAEEPPADTPPAEEPPADTPPAEEPPNDPGNRGIPPKAIETDGENNFFLVDLLNIILSIFGLSSEKAPTTTLETDAVGFEPLLGELVPVTDILSEDLPAETDPYDEMDFAA